MSHKKWAYCAIEYLREGDNKDQAFSEKYGMCEKMKTLHIHIFY